MLFLYLFFQNKKICILLCVGRGGRRKLHFEMTTYYLFSTLNKVET